MYICPSINMYFQLGGSALHLDNRDSDAIVAHPTARYDIRLSGTGGNAIWRRTRGDLRIKSAKHKRSRVFRRGKAVGWWRKGKVDEIELSNERVSPHTFPHVFTNTTFFSILSITYHHLISRPSVLDSLNPFYPYFRLTHWILWRRLAIILSL